MSDITTLPAPTTVVTIESLLHCTEILEAVAKDSLLLSQMTEEERIRLLVAAGQMIRPDKMEVRRRHRTMRRQKNEAKRTIDRALRANSVIRSARMDSVFVPPPRALELEHDSSTHSLTAPAGVRPELQKPRGCYICKAEYTQLHHFYDSLCPSCAPFNYEKRFQTSSLTGRVAVITGARLKIGYQAALMMLRAGAKVIVTTRFPQDAAIRYAKEPDFSTWADRIEVFGLDLRHSPSVEIFVRYLDQSLGRLDILINNAAQTVRRPPGFYAHLMTMEDMPHADLPANVQRILRSYEIFKSALRENTPSGADGTTWVSEWHSRPADLSLPAPGVLASAQLSQIPYACHEVPSDPSLFPAGRLDADLQQVDLRKMNSWRMTLADVPTSELLEVQLVNSIAPFILCSQLKPLMMRDRTNEKHIVNVSAMEGKFARHTKTDKHPHTNMAKAALNMMTLTSARDYTKHGIFMNAVDTGWVTDEDPAEISARKQQDHDFQPPLDIVDGAARVIDPIFSGLATGKHSWGNFLKDYVPTEW
jgi:NAD(P)-dependent dehydrogenase (short-subunit alcohol dehydrogenase family)